jgi:hypothetical protein
MNKYWLSVITGYNSPNFCGMSPFTVEADGFDYSSSGAYRFYIIAEKGEFGINRTETVAMYPIDRTIIKKIEKISE